MDEAHHLGVDERTGKTLAYSLVSELEMRKKINSLLFLLARRIAGRILGFLA